MKKLILLTLLVCGCAGSSPTYNLETLKDDISSFSADQQSVLVRFSTTFEQSKAFQDSILGVPVVLVPSLSYTEILEFIEAERRRLTTLDSSTYVNILALTAQHNTDNLGGVSIQRWVIDDTFLVQAGLMLTEGRNFSAAFDDKMSILISRPLADKLGVGIGDSVQLDETLKVIGVFESLPTTYPTDEHLIVAEMKRSDDGKN